MEYKEYELGELLYYEQPTPYIVESTDYNDAYETPVLTAGKSFILGYTDEKEGIYDQLPVIIFDDFTTASQYVNFKFKVKSSAMKILTPVTELVLPKYIYYRIQIIQFDHSTHKRYWIQQYSKIRVSIPPIPEQERIVARIEELFSQLAAVGHVDLVNVVHEVERLLLADVFVQRAAKVVGDVIFSVGKSACSAESVHDRAGLTLDTAFDFVTVDRAVALLERVTGIKYCNL